MIPKDQARGVYPKKARFKTSPRLHRRLGILEVTKARSRHYINLPRKTALPFSDAVLAGDTLFVSGRIGIDPSTGMAPAELEQELEFLFNDFAAVLAHAQMSMDDLVWVQVFSPDVSLWERFNAAYLKRFSKELPARAFVGSGPLLKGGRFEMMGIAMRQARQ
jgi:enamine deaminase RidA (YjgF/YER057c/UK114 family)